MRKLVKITALSVVVLMMLVATSCRRDHCPGSVKAASVEANK